MSSPEYAAAQKFLLDHLTDPETAAAEFRWPKLDRFNWALDWFDDALAAGPLRDRSALRIVGGDAEDISFGAMSERSNRIANGLRRLGVRRGDRILLMTGNVAPHWETMLAGMKLGALLIPSTLLLTADDLAQRVARARVGTVIVPPAETPKFAGIDAAVRRISLGEPPPGWMAFDDLRGAAADFTPDSETQADDPALLYFTSGTTSKPKMVLHSHRSFPVGHLATTYWLGAKPGDIHMGVGAPGWAGHTFMAFFAPWNAGASIVALNQPRFDAHALLDTVVKQQVTTFFAPPTVWRMLLQEDLRGWPVALREAVSGGEPLNPEVIEQVRRAWDLTVRDGWGQSELTGQIANSPARRLTVGALGPALPGCAPTVLDANDGEAEEGELAVPLTPRPPGLMLGYLQEDGAVQPITGKYYRTGDFVRRSSDGVFTFIGRVDDVFKSSDYRISPFELESVLIEHPAVVEAAVVPSPDPIRLVVPKAFIALAAGHEPTAETARSVFRHIRARMAPYKRVRRIAFGELPKNVAGKIRRVELRRAEAARGDGPPPEGEFREEDFEALV